MLVIGTNPSPLLDLVISCHFPIGTNPHRQLSCRLVTIFPPADLHLINSRCASKIRVKKWCQYFMRYEKACPWIKQNWTYLTSPTWDECTPTFLYDMPLLQQSKVKLVDIAFILDKDMIRTYRHVCMTIGSFMRIKGFWCMYGTTIASMYVWLI